MDYGDADLDDNNKKSDSQPVKSQTHIQVKTGTVHTLMKNPPVHIKDASDFEPLYPPQEFILEESLRREAEYGL